MVERYSFDTEYVQRLKESDPATQRHFFHYFGALLDSKLRFRLRSPQLVEEARQETFLRVLTLLHRDSIQQPERLGALVNSVCNNVLLECYRTEKRSPAMPEHPPDRADERPDPESQFATQQQTVLVTRMLEELSVKDRELIRQIFLEERDKDQVCREFHIDRAYLRVLLHRARTRFRAVLEQQKVPSAR